MSPILTLSQSRLKNYLKRQPVYPGTPSFLLYSILLAANETNFFFIGALKTQKEDGPCRTNVKAQKQ